MSRQLLVNQILSHSVSNTVVDTVLFILVYTLEDQVTQSHLIALVLFTSRKWM